MERERFLAELAERLGRPRLRTAPARPPCGVPESYLQRPLGEPDDEDRCQRFRIELERVGGKAVFAATLAEVRSAVQRELMGDHTRRAVSYAASEFDAFELRDVLREAACHCWLPGGGESERALFRARAAEADVGITTVDYAVANTGTLVLSANAGRPRCASLLPTLHVALVRESQIVDRMGSCFDAYRNVVGGPPSAVHFVTGPSRTSDIENDLAIGVHGPAAVLAIVWSEVR